MSKKHKNRQHQTAVTAAVATAGLSHQAEYRVIKLDLIKVLILNAVYLAAILALYYGNRQTGVLDNWFAKILHF